MNNPEIAKHLQALKDKHWNVRGYTAQALGKIGDTSAVPALIQALKDENSSVRTAAAYALGSIGDDSAVPALLEALKDNDSNVRSSAAEVLGKIGIAAVPALIEALKDENLNACYSAAQALGKIGYSTSLPRKILAAAQFKAHEKINILDDLRRIRYKDQHGPLRYNFSATRVLCQEVIKEDNPDARAGAQAVLDSLDGNSLLRASQRNIAGEPQELLRASQGGTTEVQSDALLRGADATQENVTSPHKRHTLRERLFGSRDKAV